MSSPASADWAVIENARLIALAREQAWAEIRRLEARIGQLRGEVRAASKKYGEGFVPPDVSLPGELRASESLQTIERHEAALRSRCREIEEGLARAIAEQETSLLLVEMARHAHGPAVAGETVVAPPRRATADRGASVPPPGHRDAPTEAERHAEVRRVMARLDGSVSANERRDISQAAEAALLASDTFRAEAWTYELRLRIQRANEKARAQQRDAERAVQLRTELRGLEGKDIDAVVNDLESVERRERALTDSMVSRAKEVEQAARRRADRSYAAQVLKEELGRLGYEVDETFSTLMVEGGKILVTRPNSIEYRIAVSISGNEPTMDAEVIRLLENATRTAKEQNNRDLEMQETWCRDLANACAAAGKRGIKMRVPRRSAPGEKPVIVSDVSQVRKQMKETEKAVLARNVRSKSSPY